MSANFQRLVLPLIVTTVAGWVLTALSEQSKKPTLKRVKVSPKTYETRKDTTITKTPTSWKPSGSSYFGYFDGWRRAMPHEVSSTMTAAAVAALSHPLRSVIEKGNYRIVLETHYNETKGEHKGATIFVPKSLNA